MEIHKKKLNVYCKKKDLEGYKEFPTAQGRPGRNGRMFSGTASCGNANLMKLFEACITLP